MTQTLNVYIDLYLGDSLYIKMFIKETVSSRRISELSRKVSCYEVKLLYLNYLKPKNT